MIVLHQRQIASRQFIPLTMHLSLMPHPHLNDNSGSCVQLRAFSQRRWWTTSDETRLEELSGEKKTQQNELVTEYAT